MAGRNGWSISAAVNKWETTAEKLKWLRVRLTGKAQTVFPKLPQDVRENYAECVKALKQRFDPDSRRELYVAELHTRARRKEEDWASYGDVLRTLADKTYGDLEEKARERLALTQFLTHIENPQVAFGVRQKRPETVEAAVVATIELESYLGINSGTGKDSVPSVSAATPVSGPEPLAETLRMLNERLEKLEVLAVLCTRNNCLYTPMPLVDTGAAVSLLSADMPGIKSALQNIPLSSNNGLDKD
ncbi:hypothetical protein EMCRGX_G022878 [Ephydatia muelleri]